MYSDDVLPSGVALGMKGIEKGSSQPLKHLELDVFAVQVLTQFLLQAVHQVRVVGGDVDPVAVRDEFDRHCCVGFGHRFGIAGKRNGG